MRCLRTRASTAAIVVAAMVLAAALALPAGAPPFAVQVAALYAASPQAEAHFGSSVAVSGDTIVVGEPDRDVDSVVALAVDMGTVHVYVKSGTSWVLQQELRPSLQADTGFGESVAIDGDVLVVGSPRYATGKGKTGAAFVYRRTGTTWSAPTILSGETITANESYGQSVAIAGDTMVVGAPGMTAAGRCGRMCGRG
jgi:hypothetical protein